jgi:hypothetical protein
MWHCFLLSVHISVQFILHFLFLLIVDISCIVGKEILISLDAAPSTSEGATIPCLYVSHSIPGKRMSSICKLERRLERNATPIGGDRLTYIYATYRCLGNQGMYQSTTDTNQEIKAGKIPSYLYKTCTLTSPRSQCVGRANA